MTDAMETRDGAGKATYCPSLRVIDVLRSKLPDFCSALSLDTAVGLGGRGGGAVRGGAGRLGGSMRVFSYAVFSYDGCGPPSGDAGGVGVEGGDARLFTIAGFVLEGGGGGGAGFAGDAGTLAMLGACFWIGGATSGLAGFSRTVTCCSNGGGLTESRSADRGCAVVGAAALSTPKGESEGWELRSSSSC